MTREWRTLFDDDIGRMKLELWRGMVFLHFKPYADAVRVVRHLRKLRDEIAADLRALGYRRVHVYFQDRRVLERMCEGFGFRTLRRRNGWTAMEIDNA